MFVLLDSVRGQQRTDRWVDIHAENIFKRQYNQGKAGLVESGHKLYRNFLAYPKCFLVATSDSTDLQV